MGGLGESGAASAYGGGSAATSTAVAGGSSTATSGIASAAGLSAGSVLTGVGVGLTAYEMMKMQRDKKKQVKKIRQEQIANSQQKKNLLEERLAARRARIGSMGISSDGSVSAANQKLVDDTMNDLSDDDAAFNEQAQELTNDYREKYRKNLLDMGTGFANKVIK